MSGLWVPLTGVPEFASFKEAMKYARQVDEGSFKRWKQFQQAPGDGRTRGTLQCNAHQDCKVLVRVRLDRGVFMVELKQCVHGSTMNDKPRANSALTFAQVESARTALSTGARPAALRVAYTKVVMDDATEAGKPAEKLADGGVAGAYANFERNYHHACCSGVASVVLPEVYLDRYRTTLFGEVVPGLFHRYAQIAVWNNVVPNVILE